MAKKGLDRLMSEKDQFDLESRNFIDSLAFVKAELDQLNSMKRTEGWKLLEKKMREELQARIFHIVKDDIKVQTLLSLLNVTSTKKGEKALQDEIDRLLPDD